LSSTAVTRRVSSGVLAPVLPGVFRDVVVPPSTAQDALAAVLWAGGGPLAPSPGVGALASFRASGALYGLDGVVAPQAELWVPPDRRLHHRSVVVHRGEVELVDRRMIGPIPVTSPARTLIDLAAALTEEDLATAVEDAIHRGLTTPQSVARRLDALGGKGRSGAGRLREILRDRGSEAAAASRLEVRIWRTLRAAGMRPIRQHRLRVEDHTYVVDCAFPQWRLAVEGIGDRYHRSPAQRRRDHRRMADLASIHWRILPVTWQDVSEDPQAVVAKVMRSLTAAA
jgi:very-short-patch-repair endonuclease